MLVWRMAWAREERRSGGRTEGCKRDGWIIGKEDILMIPSPSSFSLLLLIDTLLPPPTLLPSHPPPPTLLPSLQTSTTAGKTRRAQCLPRSTVGIFLWAVADGIQILTSFCLTSPSLLPCLGLSPPHLAPPSSSFLLSPSFATTSHRAANSEHGVHNAHLLHALVAHRCALHAACLLLSPSPPFQIRTESRMLKTKLFVC